MADRADYRELARQSIRLAEATEAPDTKAFLLMMAQAWSKLADRTDLLQPTTIKIGERATIHSERPQ
jgi:hypothetical protein